MKQLLHRSARNAHASAIAPPLVNDVLRTSGEPLDRATREFMEPRFGHDFSRVRVHRDEEARRSVGSHQLAHVVQQSVSQDSLVIRRLLDERTPKRQAAPPDATQVAIRTPELKALPPLIPGQCPIGGYGPLLRVPNPSLNSKCRGACGEDCEPKNCKSVPFRKLLVPATDPDHHYVCIYKNVVRCGTHAGCRFHDACFDAALAGGEEDMNGAQHWACNAVTLEKWGPQSLNWINGGGPYDGYLEFSDKAEPIGPIAGPPFEFPKAGKDQKTNGGPPK